MLVTTIRGQAESHPDSDVQKRLLAAAKALADATAKLVEAAKVSIGTPYLLTTVVLKSIY